MADAVRFRRLERSRGRQPAIGRDTFPCHGCGCDRVSRLLVLYSVDVVHTGARRAGAAVAGRTDVSDRQNQPRPAAIFPFPELGGAHGSVSAARLAPAALLMVVPGDRLRPALPRGFLPGGIPVLCGSFCHGGDQPGRRHADCHESAGHRHNGCDSRPHFVVQSHRRTKSPIATWSTRSYPRGRRGMRRIVVAVLCALSAGVAAAKDGNECIAGAGTVAPEFSLPHVASAIAKNKLDIAVIGSASSELTGPGGTNIAYPIWLEQTLRGLLPGVTVKVATYTRARETASEMGAKLPRVIAETGPSLVIWQTGTADA